MIFQNEQMEIKRKLKTLPDKQSCKKVWQKLTQAYFSQEKDKHLWKEAYMKLERKRKEEKANRAWAQYDSILLSK